MPLGTSTKSLRESMLKATRLTGMGKLLDATRSIQQILFGAQPQSSPKPHPNPHPHPHPQTKPTTRTEHAPSSSRPASFTKHAFAFEGQSYPYRLYVPSATQAAVDRPMPLIVLLHGCKQDALDFAHGTAMNVLAEQHHAMVLYPEQTPSGNAMMCWNWFEPSHQQVGKGEPGMIAALTQKVAAQHGANPSRIYVAGLSAGGSMAVVVAGLYPDLFAAVGVHSGMAAGAAQDVMSAFSAMRSGAKGHKMPALPTIVFQGTGDTTVSPENGEFVTDAALAAFKAADVELIKTKNKIDAKTDDPTPATMFDASKPETAQRIIYSNNSGKPMVESWRIRGGSHAWSGGSAQGSYTDPDGPDASAAMMAFFLLHKKVRG